MGKITVGSRERFYSGGPVTEGANALFLRYLSEDGPNFVVLAGGFYLAWRRLLKTHRPAAVMVLLGTLIAMLGIVGADAATAVHWELVDTSPFEDRTLTRLYYVQAICRGTVVPLGILLLLVAAFIDRKPKAGISPVGPVPPSPGERREVSGETSGGTAEMRNA